MDLRLSPQDCFARAFKVVSEQDELPSSVGLDFRVFELTVPSVGIGRGPLIMPRILSIEVTKLTTGRLVNGSSRDGIDMVIKNLELKPKIDAMKREFVVVKSFKDSPCFGLRDAP
ncbi:hypothetical protein Tco_0991069 [Tanacetum coccineum]|uniref:Uncharacterized protein n=1 Tax=Tanacetum coccineum TaxID=301880 RepID=A0ABQ5EYI2_9ASTR